MAETEAQREKHRKEREWADWLNKIDKQADSPVFQVTFNPVIRVEIKTTQPKIGR